MWSLFCPGTHLLNRTRGFLLILLLLLLPSSSLLKFRSLSRTMEGDLRLRRDLHSPPFPCDLELLPALTCSGSDSSAITVDNTSKDLSHNWAVAPFPDQSRRWTDQLHNLYLSSLEASFVNELHCSIQLRGWSFHNNTDEAYKCKTVQNSPNMPRQSLALQDDCQKKISLERIAPMLESTADSHVLAGSQLGLTLADKASSLGDPGTYDHGLLCDEEIHARGSSAFASRSASGSLEKQCICYSFHTESGCSTTEVSDQNFKDEGASSSSMPMAKRLKTAAAYGLSSDQAVPFGKFHTTDVSTSSNSTSENIGHELLSQLPESFHVPRPYFLRDR